MNAAPVKTGYIKSGNGWAYTFLCRPKAGTSRLGAVVIGPFAEEKKSSLKPLAELTRTLGSSGIAAMRIDLRGTGDSSGSSAEISLNSMTEDVLASSEALRAECGCADIGFIGLRLGASIALLAARRIRTEALVLIEPVVYGRLYVRELERSRAIRRMLTRRDAEPPALQQPSGGPELAATVDMDGMELASSFLAELEALELSNVARELVATGMAPRHTLILQVGARTTARADYVRLAESLKDATLEAVVAEPFWLQADYVNPNAVSEKLISFLISAQAADKEESLLEK